MAATNKMRQSAHYFVEGLGLSVELRLEWDPDVVATIIPIIACVPHG